jgi:hypothetical protein
VPRVRSLVTIGSLLVACAATGHGIGRAGADEPALLATLDRLVALERRDGAWTFAAAPHTRPVPSTVVVKIAERVASPFGLADWDLVVMRSPGTPAAILALVDGYERSARAAYLDAAKRAGDLLLRTQLPSGGWYSEMPVEGDHLAVWFAATVRRTMLDDDVTTGGARALLALWRTTGDARYRAGAERALGLLVDAQLASGAWPLVWRPPWKRYLWPTFEDLATINDDTTPSAIETLLIAAEILGRDDLRVAAKRGGEWLVAVQAPPSRSGWAQQYDAQGRPAQGRRFEPPALASWESRYAIEALVALADATGDQRYCAAVARALTWLASSALRPGCWPRFRAVDSGEPVYIGSDGTRVATAALGRPGYNWVGDFGISALLSRFGMRGSVASPTEAEPAPGDPGMCPGDTPRGYSRDAPENPRALIAHAAMLRAALTPPSPSICDSATQTTSAAGARSLAASIRH